MTPSSQSDFWDELNALHIAYDDDPTNERWAQFKSRMAEMRAEGGEAAVAAERYHDEMSAAAAARGWW